MLCEGMLVAYPTELMGLSGGLKAHL